MKKLFLQYGKLMCGEFLEEPCDKEVYTHQKAVWDKMVSEYNAAVSAARDSAVEVVDMAHGFYKALLNSQNIATGEGSEQEVLFALNSLQEGQLYDTPEGWTVHIGNGCPKCGALVLEECNGDYNTCDEYPNRQIARLVPLKEPENLIASQIPYPESGIVATGIPESGEKPEMSPEDKGFAQCLREEFLINTQNYPKEYHALFAEKFKRAEENFKKLNH